MDEQTPQNTTKARSESSSDHTGSPGARQRLVPFILVIIVLFFSNIFFALAYFEYDDGDGDTDPNGGNGTVEPRDQVFGELTVYQSYQLIQNNTNTTGLVIMDVRPPTDFSEGHIPGAINLNYFNESFDIFIRILDRNLTYLVYCDGGGISAFALEDMEALGYMEGYNILNGFDRWKELGYDVEGGDS